MCQFFSLASILGQTDLNHDNNKCLIISETVQAMPIKFALKITQLKVYMIFTIPMTVTFTQGHKCIANLTIVL